MSELIEQYKRLYAGVIYDALYYDLGYRERFVVTREIRHLAGSPLPIAGPAFTCSGIRHSYQAGDERDENDRLRLSVFESMRPGEVVVMDTDRDATVAHFGDITGQVMEQAGIAGVVVDGFTRDIGRITLPLFARGVQPQDAYGKWALREFGKPVNLTTTGHSRIRICPGDMVFGDRDGVLVIPKRMVEEVAEKATERTRRENEIRAKLKTRSPREVYDEVGRW